MATTNIWTLVRREHRTLRLSFPPDSSALDCVVELFDERIMPELGTKVATPDAAAEGVIAKGTHKRHFRVGIGAIHVVSVARWALPPMVVVNR